MHAIPKEICVRVRPRDLNTAVSRLREALGDSAERPRFIETLPKRGYRFIGSIEVPAREIRQTPSTRARIVVLPFANLCGDPEQEYLSDAITDELITGLAGLAPGRPGVIARTTAMHYKGSHKDVARIAEEIIPHIPSLSGLRAGRRVRNKPTEDMLAYELYLQGRHHMNKMTPDGLTKAKQCFEGAIARDQQFALAYDALGESYWWKGFLAYVPPKQAYPVGLWAALRAVEIDPTLAEARALLGQFRVRQKNVYNWPEVRREMTLALEMDPSSPLVRVRYAVSDLLPHGLLKEAITQVESGLELDPLSWLLHFWLSCFLWLARDYSRAMTAARFFEGLDPEGYAPWFMIANICRDSGMFEEAIFHQRRAVELSGSAPQMLGWLGLALGLSGNAAEARSLLHRLQELAGQAYVPPICFLWTHLGLGEIDDAFVWMERAIDEGDSMIIPIKTYAFLDQLRGDPRFLTLLRKMNLEP